MTWEDLLSAVKQSGLAAVLLALVLWALYKFGTKFGGRAITAFENFLSNLIGEMRADREQGTENHREILTAQKETTRALTDLREDIGEVRGILAGSDTKPRKRVVLVDHLPDDEPRDDDDPTRPGEPSRRKARR